MFTLPPCRFCGKDVHNALTDAPPCPGFGQTQRLTRQKPARPGDIIELSHGRCCGEPSPVLAANEYNFTVQCSKCGQRLVCNQHHGYRLPR